MPVLKGFFKIVLKHLSVISIYFIVFISLCSAFSAQSKDLRESVFSSQAVNFTVADNDNSELSNALIRYLSEKNNFIKYENATREVIKDALYNQEIEYAAFIPQGFEQNILSGEPLKIESAQASGSMSSRYLDGDTNQFLSLYKTFKAAGYNNADAVSNALNDARLKGEVNMLKSETVDSVPPVYYYFTFMAYALMSIMMMGLSPILKIFLNRDTLTRLNCSPLSAARFNFEISLSSSLFAAAAFLILWLYGLICYGEYMFTQQAEICLLGALCFIPCCMALAYFVARAADNPATVNAAGNALSLALCFLGGVYVPLEVMSDEILNIAQFTPTYWYVRSVETAWKYTALTPEQLNGIYSFLGMELLFGAAAFAAALALSAKKRTG